MLAFVFMLLPALGFAQDPSSPTSPTPIEVATPTTVGEVELGLETFGVGNQARLGDWAAIRLRVIDHAATPRNVLLRISMRDSDGDRPEVERVIAANPGVVEGPWLYMRLPFDLSTQGSSSGLTASAYEALEPASGEVLPGAGFRAGRLLARAPLIPKNSQIVSPVQGMIAVIDASSRTMGLDAYARLAAAGGAPYSPGRAEATEIVTMRSPLDLPDRWFGLQPFEAIVWLGADPVELRGDRARAVREWVHRGGHLIVVIPPVGQTWTNQASNELFPILPVATFTRRESVDLEAFRPLLAGDKKTTGTRPGAKGAEPNDDPVRLPKSAVVHTFAPHADARAGEAVRLISAPDGQCVVVRRLVGQGAVTLIGIDLSASNFSQGASLDAVAFWHRILGKRGQFAKDTSGSLSVPSTARIDRDIPTWIRDSGRSAAGVLLALVLFAIYWLIAGPLGFAIIKKKNMARHAWVAFLAVAGVFTAIAWGGASVLRPRKVQAKHLTFIDHIYGQPVDRARGWFGILLPTYGDSTIKVGDPLDEQGIAPLVGKNLIAAWDDVNEPRSQTFPNSRAYPIDARSLDSIRVPTRATAKEIVADWSGGPPWKMPAPIAYADGTTSKLEWSKEKEGAAPLLKGVLRHELPLPIKDATIIVVERQDSFSSGARSLPAVARAYSYSNWLPGTDLDLETVQRSDRSASITGLLDRLAPTGDELIPTDRPSGSPDDRLLAISLFSHLTPPPAVAANSGFGSRGTIAQRTSTHALDLARWFTQPCLIIIGTLGEGNDAESPIPLYVDGERAATRGRTIVRWIYPLPDSPPTFPAPTPGPTLPGGNPADSTPATPAP